MGRILVLAEKPSVGRDIAKVLHCTKQEPGCLLGKEYIVSWALGHLMTLAEPEDYDPNYGKWRFLDLPIVPEKMKLKTIKKTVQQFKLLKKLLNDKEIDSIICATDSGREGELIFRYIYQGAKCNKNVQRLWISSMTDMAIREGFQNLKDSKEYDKLYLSAKCRAEADWLVGMNATRAYTLHYGTLLSIGRVQTPTLALMVERQKEINAFVSQNYFEVVANFGNFSGIWFTQIDGGRLTRLDTKAEAEKIIEKITEKNGVVIDIKTENKQQQPPLLYDLTQLQRECNQKLGFSAQKTLKIAQSLYEKHKLITYPRTDSQYISNDMKDKVLTTLQKLQAVAEYSEYCDAILSHKIIPFTKRIMDNTKVTDHHAIIPTESNSEKKHLTEEERKVYHFVVLRFLAVFFPAYRYMVTEAILMANEETFLAKGKTVLEEGWLRLYNGMQSKRDKSKEETLPAMKVNDVFYIKEGKILEKKTQPPSAYTESTLLAAMEHAGRFVEDEEIKEKLKAGGLGTPATRAAIIERLITVGYIHRKGKALIPTDKGMQLIEIVPKELKSPQTTGKWEKGLSSMAKGSMTEERFMESIKRYVKYLVEDAKKPREEEVFFEKDSEKIVHRKKKGIVLGKCPVCHNNVLENSKAYYCSAWKDGCKFTIWKDSTLSYGITLTNHMVQKILKEPLRDVNMILPQTGEHCVADLQLCQDNSGKVELFNVKRRE